jgi:single-strand DNA-binding protein
MASVNKCIFIGNLTRDVKTRFTKSGDAVTSFSIACNETWKGKDGQKQERVEYINVVTFGKLATICGEYLAKGKQVCIEGKMQTEKYEKEGRDIYTTKIVANNMTMLGQASGPSNSGNAGGVSQGGPGSDDFLDDDIPF